jgi:hypothetical protein
MEYPLLEVYDGKKTACDHCGRQFIPGEVISVDKDRGLAFCYSDGDGGCILPYVFANRNTVCGNAMRFGEKIASVNRRTPNYPKMPLPQGPVKQGWWRRFLGL